MNQRIYNYCLHLLARQDYSEFKLKQKLRRSKKENLPEEIDEAIDKLKEKGLLKEESYRRLFIRKWIMKGESEKKIRMRGAQEKLTFNSEEFSLIETELGISEDDNLEKLIAKKLRCKDIPVNAEEKFKLRDKVLRFLISKGHSYEEAKRSLQDHFKASAAQD